MWKRVAIYGLLLAAGVLALQGLQYQRLARLQGADWALLMVALAFLALGVWVGGLLMRRAPKPEPEPKPAAEPSAAQALSTTALGISPRELMVLQELAAGRSNKEIATRLHVSPHTVKTHVAHLFEKLGARRRTEAIHKARERGIVP